MMPLVLIACFEKNVWIKIIGRGSFQCSPCLKKIVQEQLAQGHHNYTIDLVECEQLDSTFMGTLTGIAQGLKAKSEGGLRVINVSESNRELMENLGLDQLFPISPIAEGKELPPRDAQDSFSQVTDVGNLSKESVEETVRSAHQSLVTANESNVPKFQSLLEMI